MLFVGTSRALVPLGLAAALAVPLTAQVAPHRPSSSENGPEHGGPYLLNPGDSCVSAADRKRIDRAIADYRAAYPASLDPGTSCEAYHAKYAFYPMGGTVWGDLFIGYFNDLDDDVGEILDFDCRDWTYDGHTATDTGLRSFGEQAIGVPVYSAMDGIVVDSHDGEPDMNTVGLGQPANYAVIDHGHGRIALYFHFKKDSVAVEPGDVVAAGQQIGLTGSSGNSTGPHLHFATYDFEERFEPYAGPCRPGESGWYDQTPVDLGFGITDAGLSRIDITFSPMPPFALPRTGQFEFGAPARQIWFFVKNFPANAAMAMRIRRPDGSVAGAWSDTWSNGAFRAGWYYLNLPFHPDLNAVTGTWTAELDVGGSLAAALPFEVTPAFDPHLNHPPEPITAAFDPPSPRSDEVVFCRVGTDLVLDDLDYEILTYEYEWRLNGEVVRTVLSAGHADAIPGAWTAAGDVVSCTVTPMDATSSGAPVTVAVTVDSATFDRNGNLVDDAVDIASGTSADANLDGVPDECQAPVLYVDRNAAGAEHGTSWSDAYTDLQPALRVASRRFFDDPVTIWVAAGTYRPDGGCGDRSASFVLPPSVRLLGGFGGTETSESQRDPDANATILSGDLLGDDLPGFTNRSDNSRHVLWCGATEGECVVDGFVVRGGHANDLTTFVGSRGAGLWLRGGAPEFVRCRFEDNWVAAYGGAIHADAGASPIFELCEVSGNEAVSGGGGVQLWNCDAIFTETIFESNHTNGLGGAIRSHNVDSGVSKCEFRSNTADGHGGAIRHQGSGTTAIAESTFELNVGYGGGGAVSVQGDMDVISTTFVGNMAPGWDAGAVWVIGGTSTFSSSEFLANSGGYSGGAVQASAQASFVDCRFEGNSAVNDGGAIRFLETTGSQELRDCVFESNSCGGGGGAVATYGQPPLEADGTAPFTIRNARFRDNNAGTVGGALWIIESGADIDGCLFVDNTAASGSVLLSSGADLAIANCTTFGNLAGSAPSVWAVGGSVLLSNSIVRDTGSPALFSQGAVLLVDHSNVSGGHAGVGNIDEDPLFRDPGSYDFRLDEGSPSIDAGRNSALTPGIMTDLAGGRRRADHPSAPDCPYAKGSCGTGPIVDMGAFERGRHPNVVEPGASLPLR